MKIPAHPDLPNLAVRLKTLGRNFDVSFEEDLFRFINPQFSKPEDIVSGAGALHAAGRWNLERSAPLSYASVAPETALAEALAHVKYYRLPKAKALPRVLVALRLKAQRVLDLRDGRVRKALRLSKEVMRKMDWRAENQAGAEALTQAWGKLFAAAGFEAVIVPSAADSGGSNVLVFPKNLQPGSRFQVKNEVKWA
jgi:RES domain-containing protein